MIRRIVKMHFRPEGIDPFVALFEKERFHIRHFPGCTYLELVQSIDDPAIFFTISEWDSALALDHYRQSELFRSTWAATKALFAERAEAWSTATKYCVDPS